jgi:hypothetical protein
MFESGTPRDRAEIAASEAVNAAGENRRRRLRRLCHQGRGGGEALASPEDDVQDVGCVGRTRFRDSRQQTASEGACGTSEREHSLEKGSLRLFREAGRVRWWSVKCAGVGGMGRIKVGGRQGKGERMDLADDLHEEGGNERAALWHARRQP